MQPDHSAFGIVIALAGPVATVVAACAAVFVTYRLGTRQLAIAQNQATIASAQRDLAYERLKYDLFEKRYEIYLTARLAIEKITQHGTERPIQDMELLAQRIKLDEARFFFPPKTVSLIETIDKLVTSHEVARMSWDRFNDEDGVRLSEGEKMATAIDLLLKIYRKLPELFEAELGFALLTGKQA
jgi:hypothetical protein